MNTNTTSQASRPPRTPRTAAKVLLGAVLVLGGTGVLTSPAAASPARGDAPDGRPAAVALPPAAQAARSTKVEFDNRTASGMQRIQSELQHGCWTTLVPEYISGHQLRSWESESCGMMTGTEGRASFSVPGGEVAIHWNNPYVGSNTYHCTAPSGYRCVKDSSTGGGNNATVRFQLSGAPALVAKSGTAKPPAAQAARSTHVTFNNHTDRLMARTDARLSWGVWTANQYPPEAIPPGNTRSWQSESEGFATGTEGEATYVLQGVGNVKVRWNNPYVGSNSYECSAPAGYQCRRSGGGGDNASPVFTLS
ncbi:aegerolysin family protein [Streptomyces sp. NRRL S-118]|uniref:aegerolysin family protein n=1 Tax=Streptomyces sp. NRRL S-118 TaxID=1463881 RepID=UPI0004CA095A|nr:aegerolysin family protein [Streptomyces sp. NRRL S-118]